MESILLTIFIFDLCLSFRLRNLVMRFLIKLRLNNRSSMGFNIYYLLILLLIMLSFFILNDSIYLYLFYIYIYFIFKFIIYNFYLTLKYYFGANRLNFFVMSIYLLFFFFLGLLKFLIMVLFLIDFVVCIMNFNDEYNLLFMGFTEDFATLILTSAGKVKVIRYLEFLIYENSYSREDFNEFSDFRYKHFLEKYR